MLMNLSFQNTKKWRRQITFCTRLPCKLLDNFALLVVSKAAQLHCKEQRFVSVPRPSLTSFEDPVLLSSEFFFFMERGFGPLTRLRFRGPGTVSCPLLVTCSGCGASAAGSSASGEATASAFSSCRRAALCSRSFKCSLSASLCTPWKKHR
jgi:hypothetical protein